MLLAFFYSPSVTFFFHTSVYHADTSCRIPLQDEHTRCVMRKKWPDGWIRGFPEGWIEGYGGIEKDNGFCGDGGSTGISPIDQTVIGDSGSEI